MDFTVIIPARYGATRLPGKPLREVEGKPLIQHVHERAALSGAGAVVIATDDERVAEAARGFGARVCMTRADHASGTDRLLEAAQSLGLADEAIVVNLQGDEPQMPPVLLKQVALALEQQPDADMATLCEPLREAAELFDPDVVKLVRDARGFALYFSRAPIPWDRERFADPARRSGPLEAGLWWRHVGLYAYRVAFLRRFAAFSQSDPERLECLEQLRALHYGAWIHVGVAKFAPGRGIDTPADLEHFAAELAARPRPPGGGPRTGP